MTTSGTYTFSPSLGDVVLAAYRRCGVHATQITAQHILDARFESNLMMSDWAADGINLWQVAQGALTLTQGTETYALPANIVFLLDCFIGTGTNPRTDRLIFPISRSDYAAIPNKTTQGKPTSFWFERLLNPNIFLWPVPDANSIYTLFYHHLRQAQDSELGAGTDPEIPWTYIDAFAWGLASRLALIYAPDRADRLEARAMKSWQRALSVGTENVPIAIIPEMRGYFR